VAITLKVTPRINSSNYVTLELEVEVQEIEEDDSGLDVNQAGFITSNRQVQTVALVKDNQTVVLGGLVGTTETEVETKVPVLGDLPLIGALFRGSRKQSRKSNLMIFITPHIIDDEEDMWEIQRVKEAQRQEFMRRFYGKSRDKQMAEMQRLLQYSMNNVDQPSLYRGPSTVSKDLTLDGTPVSAETRQRIQDELDASRGEEPGEGAGQLPDDELIIIDDPQE
jgi:type II secretory pathway component GspD/PulD (secretin)